MIVKKVKGHKIRKGYFQGLVYLPSEWIGKDVMIQLYSKKKMNVIEQVLKEVGFDEKKKT